MKSPLMLVQVFLKGNPQIIQFMMEESVACALQDKWMKSPQDNPPMLTGYDDITKRHFAICTNEVVAILVDLPPQELLTTLVQQGKLPSSHMGNNPHSSPKTSFGSGLFR